MHGLVKVDDIMNLQQKVWPHLQLFKIQKQTSTTCIFVHVIHVI